MWVTNIFFQSVLCLFAFLNDVYYEKVLNTKLYQYFFSSCSFLWLYLKIVLYFKVMKVFFWRISENLYAFEF